MLSIHSTSGIQSAVWNTKTGVKTQCLIRHSAVGTQRPEQRILPGVGARAVCEGSRNGPTLKLGLERIRFCWAAKCFEEANHSLEGLIFMSSSMSCT